MKSYTKQEIIEKCEKALKDVKSFYKGRFINYSGKTSDTHEFYTEIIADFVIKNISEFEKIPVITRESSYNTDTHKGEFDENSPRIEEITAMKLFNQSKAGYKFNKIGEVIDYQTPLKNKQVDEAGKIDLVSVNGKIIYLLELKKEKSPETMLRCVLEGYTYLKTIDAEKFKKNFKLAQDSVLKASPLVFINSKQWKEMQEERPKLNELIKLLDCEPFYLKQEIVYEID